ncbi:MULTISPECIES: glutamate-1-semialdehyde 2,1-aminomutase [Psychrobacter]|uniref:Glutamate-1-semialdehyde 2,1-aminomutase n=1 Tax=Psychrobacter halodurans TaxID=2818439 RepID=A0AAW4IPQ9_9GAMM|nr:MULTISPECIES: glutamate-1-semialdehyde 2,1-aminomutase [Psychrobacter]MBO1517447.1 glutamate-1-semialdehyde 2,1-aminomutase [Psychrobacter halodurans]MDN5734126.1 glutamate-1-semialdehyde 2,1-aminomutase [Psychrobacter sp.]OLF40218.1 glutamate-1-semialdehyde-2,1-aminomutase [Psychrobacter sp. Rd 27.2]PJX27167.1 glutamate-1-semialdehyde-2,1-aminomutase [Psychrobacter sp. L7]
MSTKNEQLFAQARKHIPGGVNSPVRAFAGVGGTPIFMHRASGSKIYDTEDNGYIDYVGSWGPMILGHAHPKVIDAVKKAADDGLSFGTPTPFETTVADKICEIVPSVEMIRMTNSGTEATMSAIRLARGYTGRDKIVKFEGCYHGHSDSLLVKAGSGMLDIGEPTSKGVPADFAKHTITIPYNDPQAIKDCFEKWGDEIACVILEPIAGNMNMVVPTQAFHDTLRAECTANDAVLIFDEVMTGFRVGLGGAQAHFGIDPDLTCFGKIIGAGLPVGAFGGKEKIMSCIAPLGGVYQAGTLSGNPLAMRAGIAMFEDLTVAGFYDELSAKVDKLISGFQAAADKHGINLRTNNVGGMFGMFFVKDCDTTVPQNFNDVTQCDMEAFNTFFHGMLDRGIYLAPSAYEAGFMSIKHSDADIDASIKAADEIFAEMATA